MLNSYRIEYYREFLFVTIVVDCHENEELFICKSFVCYTTIQYGTTDSTGVSRVVSTWLS